jgi:hypothetical protein
MNDVPKNHVRLANGKLRAKPGHGKQPQITLTLQKHLQQVRSNESLDQKANLSALHRFTRIFVSHARDLAKAGKKDAARNWCHFFEGARIEEIVSSHNAADGSSLRSDINQLRGECHPDDVISNETDLQFIRSALEQILKTLEGAGESATPPVEKSPRPASHVRQSPAPSFSRRQAKRLVQKF